MKTIFKMMALFVLLFSAASCGDDEVMDKDPIQEVNYANIAGTWRLAEWNGKPLDDNRYFYITFNRKAVDEKRTYTIYQNFDSATSRHITGTFNIEDKEDIGYILTGSYNYWEGDWNHDYVVTELRAASMIWTVKDDPEDVSLYVRCAEVPADIIKGTRAVNF